MLDPIATAGLVTREVRTGARDGEATKITVARRTYHTTQADLWDAVTNIERLPRWFLPIVGDLEVGGRYQLEGNAGGTIERCDAPERFAVTWEFGGMMSWVDVSLVPAPDGTTLELLHEASVDPEFWTEYGPGAAGVGWDLGLMGLGLHLENGEPVAPEFVDWPTTPDGVVFVRRAATGWADAAVADGDTPDAAHEAAERTVEFYTVAPDAVPEG